MNLVLIKLNTGEEIIAKIFEGPVAGFLIKSPRTIVIQQDQQGRPQAGFIPSMMLANDDAVIEVNPACICLSTKDINPEYERIYLEQTSGIKLAPGIMK